MSGGAKKSKSTINQTTTKDFIPWLKPSAEEYLSGAQQEYRAEPAHYQGFFQNLFRPDDGSDPNRLPQNQMDYLGALSGFGNYDRSKPLDKGDFGRWATQGPKKARPIAQNLLDEANKLEGETLPWLRGALAQQQALTGKAARRQNAPANIASTQKQIDDALARIATLRTPEYDPGDITGGNPLFGGAGGLGTSGAAGGSFGPGGFDGGMAGFLNDYANTQLIGDTIAPWTKEQQEAFGDTSRIARENIGRGDTNAQLRDFLMGMMNRSGGDSGENPELDAVIQRAQGDQQRAYENLIRPRLDSAFARGNAFGGSGQAFANAEAERQMFQEQGRVSEDIRYKDWIDRQNRRLQAAGLFGSTGASADSRYRDIAALSSVGEQRQAYTQRLMEEAYRKFLGERAIGQEDLDRFGNAINMLGSHTGVENLNRVTKNTESGGGSGIGGLLGPLLAAGSALIPGIGPAASAGLTMSGSLANLFGGGKPIGATFIPKGG